MRLGAVMKDLIEVISVEALAAHFTDAKAR